MAGKGMGATRDTDRERLSDQIANVKYALLFFNVFVIVLAVAVFALNVWLCFDAGLGEWIRDLRIQEFYIGTYILIFFSVVIIISGAIGCFSIVAEHNVFIMAFIGTQIACFIVGAVGAAVILEFSTQHSAIQPMIRESLRRLIINAHHEPSRKVLAIIQENVGCCGADGPVDYTSLHQPLPSQCRDTVTGNPFFHGCVDELTWFFEEKTGWIAGLAMTLCFMHVINVVMSLILAKALPIEAKTITGTYRN